MNVIKLAQLLESKYQLKVPSEVHEKSILSDVKKEIVHDAFTNYVSSHSKDPALQIVAGMGYIPVVNLVHTYQKLVANIDQKTPKNLIDSLNELLELMYDINSDKFSKVFNFINDNVMIRNQAAKNERERLKQKFSKKMERLFSITQKVALKLKTLVPEVSVYSGQITPQRKPLTRDELRDFVMMAPSFQRYGLDSLDVMAKIIEDNELKEMVTTLINAIKRGHTPLDGAAVQQAAKKIKVVLELKQTNESVFNDPEEKFQKVVNAPQELDEKKKASWLQNIVLKYGDKESL